MPLTPEQAVALVREMWVPMYVNEHPLTKSVIAAIPADKGDYKPADVARSAIDLAWHIVSAEHRFLNAVIAGGFDYSSAPAPSTSADVLRWYSSAFAADIEKLNTLSGEQLVRPIDFRGMFTFPAYAFLQSGISHTIHHRGQLSTYLRPMGARVPSIYGESYDSRQPPA
jgi:uncharacterized damage-inducible protein DinB